MPPEEMVPGYPPGEEGTKNLLAELTMAAIEETKSQIQQTDEHIKNMLKTYHKTIFNRPLASNAIILLVEAKFRLEDELAELTREWHQMQGARV